MALSFCAATTCAYAQIPAVTSEGEEVLLYNDGTWKYAQDHSRKTSEPAINPTPFSKSSDATFQVKSKKLPVGVWLNAKKWSFEKSGADEASEYTFELRNEDARAIMITEKYEMPLTTLRDLAIKNAKEAAPDIQVVQEEYRTVNGITVLCMQMNGTIEGIKFTYLGYYFSNESGAVQFLSYTSQNLFASYREEMERLLNGFVLTK